MKTNISTLIFICILGYTASGQYHLNWQNPLPQGHSLYTMQVLEDGTVYAAGDRGTVVRQFPGTSQWDVRYEVLPSWTERDFWELHFVDAQNGWAVYEDPNRIYITRDGGNTWLPRPGLIYDYEDIFALDSLTAWVTGAQGVVHHTSDGGRTWTELRSPQTNNHMLAVYFLDAQTGWIAGANVGLNPNIFHTNDGGTTWTPQTSPLGAKFHETIFFLDEQYGWIGGEDGSIIHTSDGGNTWTTQLVFPRATFFVTQDIFFFDRDNGVAAGADGLIVYTTNGGNNWQESNNDLATSNFVSQLSYDDNGTLWACGNIGLLLKSTDRGHSWIRIGSSTPNGFLYSIQFLDANNGWAAGDGWTGGVFGGDLRQTTDGGNTWISRDLSQTSTYFLQFFDQQNGIAVNKDGLVFRTSDGGTNWNMIRSLDDYFSLFFWGHFLDSNTGWLINSLTTGVLKTTDGGYTWNEQFRSPLSSLYNVFFLDVDTGWLVGQEGSIHKSTDGGSTWQLQNTPATENLYDIFFHDQNHGWAVGARGTMLKTTDGGSNWQTVTTPFTRNLNTLHFFDEHTGLILGTTTSLGRTTDGGETWEVMTSPGGASLHTGYFTDPDRGWVAGSGGIIYRYDYTLVGLEDHRPPENYPADITLNQNYPNPFNPKTDIRYQISDIRFVELVVYDVLGRMVRTLVNGNKAAGSHVVKWDGRNDAGDAVASGVYLYRLSAGQFSESRKMLLVR